MSEYRASRQLRLKLQSTETVLEKLAIRQPLTVSANTVVLSTNERVQSFGESISKNLTTLRTNFKALQQMNAATEQKLMTIARASSLHEALHDQNHQLLGALVLPNLSVSEQQTLTMAKTFLTAGDMRQLSSLYPAAEQVLDKLSDAARSAHERIASVEHDLISEKTAVCLNTLGYQVKTKQQSTGLLIRGQKQDLSIAAQITKTGELHIDMAGFEGGACTAELDRLHEELAKHGIDIGMTDREYHGKKEGGVLAQKAAQELQFAFNPLNTQKTINHNQKQRLNLLSKRQQKLHR